MTDFTRIQQRYSVAALWTSADPTLLAGEAGIESDTGRVKYGDGITAWTSLAYGMPIIGTDFSSKNLIIDVQTNSTVDADADFLTTIDSNNILTLLTDVNLTFDSTVTTGDIVGALAPKNSTWYGMGVDKDRNIKLMPDVTGTSDAASGSFLVWAAGTAATDLFKAGDIVYNTTKFTKTTISVTPTVDGDPIALTADIFSTSDKFKIVMLSPTGLGDSWSRVGSAYANSSGNFDDSYYTRIQEETYYDGVNDLTITGQAGLSLTSAHSSVKQINDWTGTGKWKFYSNVDGTQNSNTTKDLTFGGLIFDVSEAVILDPASNSIAAYTNAGFNTTTLRNVAGTSVKVTIATFLRRKPSFHH